MLATSFTFLLLAAIARAQSVALELTGVEATFYYDLDEEIGIDVCSVENGGPDVANWAISSGINSGVTYCQGSDATAYTLESLGSNRVVAMNATMVKSDPSYWCGKEVQVFDSDGNEIVLDEGPFVLYDACAACADSTIIDMSAKAFAQIKGGTCSGNNPTGLTVKVLDTNISPSGTISGNSMDATATATISSSSSPTPTTTPSSTSTLQPTSTSSASIRGTGAWWSASSASAHASTSLKNTNNYFEVVTVSGSAFSSSSAPMSTSSPAVATLSTSTIVSSASASVSSSSNSTSCTYGAWQCDGLEIQVCNYVSTTSVAWVTVASCPSVCSINSSGNVDCE